MAADRPIVIMSAYAHSAKNAAMSVAPANCAPVGPSATGFGERDSCTPRRTAICSPATIPMTMPAVRMTTSDTRADGIT